MPWLTQFDLYGNSVVPVSSVKGSCLFYQQLVVEGMGTEGLGVSIWFGEWVDRWRNGDHQKLTYTLHTTVTHPTGYCCL